MTLISGVGSLRAAAVTDLIETENAGGTSGRSTIHQLLNAGVALAKPVVADFTVVNQGTATIADTDRGVLITHIDHAGAQNRILAKTKPAPPFTLTVKVTFVATVRSFSGYGIGWRKASTAEVRCFHNWHFPGSLFQSQAATIATDTASLSNQTVTLSENASLPQWVRISDDGTTRKHFLSNDGDNYIQVFSEAVSAFISTADQIVVYDYLNNTSGAGDQKSLIEHWLVT